MTEAQLQTRTVLLHGEIFNLERSRRSRDFVLTQVERQNAEAAALGASVMGMGAAGIGLLNMAANSSEEADWVEFELSGKKIQGWLWMMPMRNGDPVEVVAEQIGENRYLAYAVKRNTDGIVAIYPHATAGRKAHYKSVAKLFVVSFLFINAIGAALMYSKGEDLGAFASFMVTAMSVSFICFAVLFFRAARKMMGFVKVAEVIFRTYGWPDVESINLRKTSKENKMNNTSPKYGIFYFRYK